MRPTVQINYAGFKAMAEEMSRLSGKDFSSVVKTFAAQCAKMAALDSNVAKLNQIQKQVRERASYNYAFERGRIFVGRNGRVWFRSDTNNKFYMVFDSGPSRGWRLPTLKWADYLYGTGDREAYIKARIAEKAKRRAIERLSWLQIGDALDVPLSSVGPQGNLQEPLARGAAVNGKQFKNGTATDSANGAEFTVTIRDDSPVAIKRSGQDRLDRNTNRSVKAFEFAAQRGFLADLQFRAKRWPGIFVTAA